MSNSNLIPFQKITEPENLNFVFPLSRYNQTLNGIKNNFYSIDLSLSYDIKDVFPIKNLNIRPAVGYQTFIGSIYSSEKWKISGLNLSLGFNYSINNKSTDISPKDLKPLVISDTIIIKDTIYTDKIVDKNTFDNLLKAKDNDINAKDINNITLYSRDTTYNSKSNLEYNLNIITIKETFENINYILDTTNNYNNNFELIIPNLAIKYLNNGILIDKYIGKVEKELFDYNLIQINCDDFLQNNLIEASNNHKTIIRDTIYHFTYPTFNFNLDVFSENEIKQSYLILNGFIEKETKLIYSDTIYFANKTEISNYNINYDNFVNINKNNLHFHDNKFTTNYNLRDFTINYNLFIEDNNSVIDSTISGEIIMSNTEDKPKKANKLDLITIDSDCLVKTALEAKGSLIDKNVDIYTDKIKRIGLIELKIIPQFLPQNNKYYLKK